MVNPISQILQSRRTLKSGTDNKQFLLVEVREWAQSGNSKKLKPASRMPSAELVRSEEGAIKTIASRMRISRYDTTCPYQWPTTRGVHLQEHILALNRDIRIKRLHMILYDNELKQCQQGVDANRRVRTQNENTDGIDTMNAENVT